MLDGLEDASTEMDEAKVCFHILIDIIHNEVSKIQAVI
jgi:hypothetical protein